MVPGVVARVLLCGFYDMWVVPRLRWLVAMVLLRCYADADEDDSVSVQ